VKENKSTLTCIVCPVGCELEVLTGKRKVILVKGNRCPRGLAYAEEEMKPKRILITVVKVRGGKLPVVSVKTLKPIPKELMFKAAEYLAEIEMEAPVRLGDIVVEDLLGLGTSVVATRECK